MHNILLVFAAIGAAGAFVRLRRRHANVERNVPRVLAVEAAGLPPTHDAHAVGEVGDGADLDVRCASEHVPSAPSAPSAHPSVVQEPIELDMAAWVRGGDGGPARTYGARYRVLPWPA